MLFRKQSAVEDHNDKGFTYDLDQNTYKAREGGDLRMVGLDDAASTRSLFLAELAAIPWSCGPDDTPPPPPAQEE